MTNVKPQDRRSRYEDKRIKKTISFNAEKDSVLLDYANKIPDFSNWAKEKLKQEMQQKKPD